MKHQIKSATRKVLISSILILSLMLSYFILAFTIKNKSIKFVTDKILENLENRFGKDNVELSKTEFGLTYYGTVKVTLRDLKIIFSSSEYSIVRSFTVPIAEVELSLLKFFMLDFKPSRIKVVDPEINIQDSDFGKIVDTKDESLGISKLLFTIKNNSKPIDNLEIENAKINIIKDDISLNFIIKNATLNSYLESNGFFDLKLKSKISFDNKNDIDFDAGCDVFNNIKTRCQMSLKNFTFEFDNLTKENEEESNDKNNIQNKNYNLLKFVTSYFPQISGLEKIGGFFNANFSIIATNGEIDDFSVDLRGDKGSFFLNNIFPKEIKFKDLIFNTKYNHDSKTIDFDRIEAKLDFEDEMLDNKKSLSDPEIKLSVVVSDIDKPKSKSQFNIEFSDILTPKIKELMPIPINKELKEWIFDSINDGHIRVGRISFLLLSDGEDSIIQNPAYEFVFVDTSLKYSSLFPEMKNMFGIVNIDDKKIVAKIFDGSILNNLVRDSTVSIYNLNSNKPLLNITGRSVGPIGDVLKYLSKDQDVAEFSDKYLNIKSNNHFKIQMPLKDEIGIKDISIFSSSEINESDNDIFKGSATIKVVKEQNKNVFLSEINLENSEFYLPIFNYKKKSGDKSNLNFHVAVEDNKMMFDKISLKNQNKINNKNGNITKSSISGRLIVDTKKSTISEIIIKNRNVGENNYDFSYSKNSTNSNLAKINIDGKKIDLASIINSINFKEGGQSIDFNLSSKISSVLLQNKKTINDLSLSLNCDKNIYCDLLNLKASYNKKDSININSSNDKDGFVKFDGKITNLGYIIESFGISNLISGGNAVFNVKHYLKNNKPNIEGDLVVNEDITFYENENVKKLAKDTLFSQIKDKIFSSNKTTFGFAKANFEIDSKNINVKSFVANNYKIGITAKGNFNIDDQSYYFKGMIVPGFIINNLFGIGNIPIIGGIFNTVLTGGDGGGVFGIKYEYKKDSNQTDPIFTTNKASAFVPSTIQNLF